MRSPTCPTPSGTGGQKHSLADILAIALCAVIAGADSWEEVERFGQAKQGGLKTFLALPNGIPSHDTFYRLFTRLDPDAFARCVTGWLAGACEATGRRHVAIDGKASLIKQDSVRGGVKAKRLTAAWDDAYLLKLVQGLPAVLDA